MNSGTIDDSTTSGAKPGRGVVAPLDDVLQTAVVSCSSVCLSLGWTAGLDVDGRDILELRSLIIVSFFVTSTHGFVVLFPSWKVSAL